MEGSPELAAVRLCLTQTIDRYTLFPDMTPTKKLAAFRLDPELSEGLQAIKDRDGVPIAEQVRRAIRTWLDAKGIHVKAERKRAATRKRP